MTRVVTAILLSVSLAPLACGGGGEGESAIAKSMPKPTKSLKDLKQKSSDMTPEELAEARRKAGFKSRDEIAAENAAEFEKSAREYIKTRMKEYKALLGDLRGALDSLEKWSGGKNAAKGFDKFAEKYRESAKEITKTYDTLTARGAEGGNTQAMLGKAFRSWEDLNNDLSPELAGGDRLSTAIAEIRKSYDEVEKALEDIDKDESLVVNKFYKGEGKDDEKKGG